MRLIFGDKMSENHDNGDSTVTSPPKKLRGFAAMPKDKLREISSRGGKSAHETGVAHEFQMGSAEAKMAGIKGGQIAAEKKRRMRNESANAIVTSFAEAMEKRAAETTLAAEATEYPPKSR